VLRASGTETHRSNSVTVLHESTLLLSGKVTYCEAWYAACQQPIIFRINEAISPSGLDELLAERSYRKEAVTLVMTSDLLTLASLPNQPQELPLGVRLVERSIADSLSELHRMKGNARALAEQEIKRQELWRGPQIVLSLRSINGVLCSGMARIEEGHLGLFDIYTPENQRGNGYASILVSELLAWGVKMGAHTAFLQVVENNEPALAIYQRFGFKTKYRYWSRVKDSAGGG
jgi:N-acetylglutamate synthase